MYPNLRDPVLRLQLGKGLGHNTYGEPAWPNDLLYMFPICILAIVFSASSLHYAKPVESHRTGRSSRDQQDGSL